MLKPTLFIACTGIFWWLFSTAASQSQSSNITANNNVIIINGAADMKASPEALIAAIEANKGGKK